MKYQQSKFTIPIGASKLTDLEYDLRVGNITQREYERRKKEQDKSNGN